MDLYPELADLSLDELVARLRSGGNYDDYYEAVVERIAASGRPGIDCLYAELDRKQLPQALAVIDGLFQVSGTDPIFGARMRELLREHESDLLAEAIVALGYLGAADVQGEVLGFLDHESPTVRSAVLQYVRRNSGESAKPILIRALSDRHALVRESAVDELGDLGAVDAITDLTPLVEDSNEAVRQAARTAVASLTELAAAGR
ncbi:HEAT repeat domain-containing protein [Nocardia sp. NPDC127579]|uniref:HEAT repeat domain-containing protein n=1 Tax=Nocardia sp. NPDC127579 TaxID=3345402 RepID=UPI003635528F